MTTIELLQKTKAAWPALSAAPAEEKNRLLFEKLDDAVTRDKLYLNPDLSREDLVKLTGVNKTRVGRILQQNTGLGTTGYINKKRLEFAEIGRASCRERV